MEQPKFWRWATLTVDSHNHQAVLHSDRVHIVQEIRIVTVDFWQGNFLKIMENILTAVLDGRSRLKKLDVRAQSDSERLSSLDTALLSQALVRLEECSFSFSCSQAEWSTLVMLRNGGILRAFRCVVMA